MEIKDLLNGKDFISNRPPSMTKTKFNSYNLNARTRLISIIVLLVICVSFLFVDARDSRAMGANHNKNNQIKIGAVLPLTGQLSYLGQEEAVAIQLAKEDFIKINPEDNLIVKMEDSRSTAKDGIAAFQKVALSNPQAVITSLTIVSEALKPITEEQGLTQAVLSIDPEIAVNSSTIIRIYYGLEQEMKLAARYISAKKFKSVGALIVNTPESHRGIEILKDNLSKSGISLSVIETYGFADKSVRNQLLRLKSAGCEAIMTIDFGYMYPTILEEAHQIGIRKRIIGGLGMMTAPPMANELKEGIAFISAKFAVAPTDKVKALSRRFDEKGQRMTFDGVFTYDTLMMLSQGLAEGKKNKSDFLSMEYAGASGMIQFKDNGNVKIEMVVAIYNNSGVAQLWGQN